MQIWIVLLRGVNVGSGNNKIIMKDFKLMLEDLGYEGVKTYIQSGNAVFKTAETSADKISEAVGAAIEDKFGFLPSIMAITKENFAQTLINNPYSEIVDDPKSLMISFLNQEPTSANFEKMDALQTDTERYSLKGTCFYFHAPDGFGRSKLAVKTEKLLGVAATSRNLRSVQKIMELAEAL